MDTKLWYPGNGYIIDLGSPEEAPTPAPTNATDDSRPPTPAPSVIPTDVDPTMLPTAAPTGYNAGVYGRAQYQIDEMKRVEWIDKATRIILIEFVTYNANSDLFCSIRLAVEFMPSGSLVPTANVIAYPLLTQYRAISGDPGVNKTTYTLMIVEIIFYLLLSLFYIPIEIAEFRLAWKNKEPYFVGWNIIDCTNYLIFFIVFIWKIMNYFSIAGLDFTMEDEFPTQVQYLILTAKIVDKMNAVNAVLCFIKIFKYTMNHRQFGQFTNTLTQALNDMALFCVVLFIVMWGYSTAFHVAFGQDLADYMDFSTSFFTLFETMLGDFDMDSVTSSNPYLGPFLFVSYIVFVFFVILSMILSIVDAAYSKVKEKFEAGEMGEDVLTEDFNVVMQTPHYMLTGFIEGFIAFANWVTPPPPAAAEEAQVVEVQEEEQEEEVPDIPLDEALTSDEPFLQYTATYRKAIGTMQELRDGQKQLQDMLDAINARLAQ